MKSHRVRWFILFLVFIATGLSFLDRQVLSITIIKIQKEFDLSDVQYGMINTSFLISYALMFTIGGRLTDKFGAKFFQTFFHLFLENLTIKYLCKYFPALCELVSGTWSAQVLVAACGARWSRIRRKIKFFASALLAQECLSHLKMSMYSTDCLSPEVYEAASF